DCSVAFGKIFSSCGASALGFVFGFAAGPICIALAASTFAPDSVAACDAWVSASLPAGLAGMDCTLAAMAGATCLEIVALGSGGSVSVLSIASGAAPGAAVGVVIGVTPARPASDSATTASAACAC